MRADVAARQGCLRPLATLDQLLGHTGHLLPGELRPPGVCAPAAPRRRPAQTSRTLLDGLFDALVHRFCPLLERLGQPSRSRRFLLGVLRLPAGPADGSLASLMLDLALELPPHLTTGLYLHTVGYLLATVGRLLGLAQVAADGARLIGDPSDLHTPRLEGLPVDVFHLHARYSLRKGRVHVLLPALEALAAPRSEAQPAPAGSSRSASRVFIPGEAGSRVVVMSPADLSSRRAGPGPWQDPGGSPPAGRSATAKGTATALGTASPGPTTEHIPLERLFQVLAPALVTALEAFALVARWQGTTEGSGFCVWLHPARLPLLCQWSPPAGPMLRTPVAVRAANLAALSLAAPGPGSAIEVDSRMLLIALSGCVGLVTLDLAGARGIGPDFLESLGAPFRRESALPPGPGSMLLFGSRLRRLGLGSCPELQAAALPGRCIDSLLALPAIEAIDLFGVSLPRALGMVLGLGDVTPPAGPGPGPAQPSASPPPPGPSPGSIGASIFTALSGVPSSTGAPAAIRAATRSRRAPRPASGSGILDTLLEGPRALSPLAGRAAKRPAPLDAEALARKQPRPDPWVARLQRNFRLRLLPPRVEYTADMHQMARSLRNPAPGPPVHLWDTRLLSAAFGEFTCLAAEANSGADLGRALDRMGHELGRISAGAAFHRYCAEPGSPEVASFSIKRQWLLVKRCSVSGRPGR